MSRQEWEAISFILGAAWPGEMTSANEAGYYFVLEQFEVEQVATAIKALARGGSKFRPSAGELASWIASHSSPATFDEAWPVVHHALRHAAASVDASGRVVVDEARCLAQIRELAGAAAAGWAAVYGVARLAQEPTNDPEYGGAVLHRLREHYTALASTDAGRGRMAAALERGPQAELKGGLRKLPNLQLPTGVSENEC